MFVVVRETLTEREGPLTETIAREIQPHRIERAVRAAGGKMPTSWLLHLNTDPRGLGLSIQVDSATLRVMWRPE